MGCALCPFLGAGVQRRRPHTYLGEPLRQQVGTSLLVGLCRRQGQGERGDQLAGGRGGQRQQGGSSTAAGDCDARWCERVLAACLAATEAAVLASCWAALLTCDGLNQQLCPVAALHGQALAQVGGQHILRAARRGGGCQGGLRCAACRDHGTAQCNKHRNAAPSTHGSPPGARLEVSVQPRASVTKVRHVTARQHHHGIKQPAGRPGWGAGGGQGGCFNAAATGAAVTCCGCLAGGALHPAALPCPAAHPKQ